MKKTDQNKYHNLKQLRVFLRMTQRQFLEKCCSDGSGNLLVSVATLSNLESRGGVALDTVIKGASDGFSIEEGLFEIPPQEFLVEIEKHFSELSGSEEILAAEREDNITNLVNRLTVYFADLMFDGKLSRGDQIEPDRALSERFGVGRSALREAMKVLHVMGLVDIRPGQGTFISSREMNIFEIPLLWSLFLTNNQIEQILILRNLLEGQAAFQAAENISGPMKEKLGQIVEETKAACEARDEERLLDLDVEFHTTIAESSRNHLIYAQIQTIRNLLRRVSRTGMDGEDELNQILFEHSEIYRYICEGKGEEARTSMQRHLDNSKGRYRIEMQ